MVAARRPAQKRSPQTADERLLVEAAQADPSKFDVLYELHFDRIYFFIVSRVYDRTIAEDLASEVFHKALANLPNYQWRGTPFSAWLFRIASNAIVDHFKRSDREQQADEREHPLAQPDLSSTDLDFIERDVHFFRLVEELPEIQRRVVCERFVEERSIREIAQRLSKTEGAIKQLQFRALQTLRARIGDRRG
jgi:RNA polymerase sigma-70 factor (ECF subfamily)